MTSKHAGWASGNLKTPRMVSTNSKTPDPLEFSIAEKQKLIPVRVEWAISAATPYLRVFAAEADEPTRVEALAHFGLRASVQSAEPETVFGGVEIVASPYRGPQSALKFSKEYEPLRIIFDSGLWVRFCPSYSEHEVIPEDAYDWSELKRGGKGVDDDRRMHWERWRETGVCPDPGMYDVERSCWLRETGYDKYGYHHYLILGHDAYVEVLAKGWKWEPFA